MVKALKGRPGFQQTAEDLLADSLMTDSTMLEKPAGLGPVGQL